MSVKITDLGFTYQDGEAFRFPNVEVEKGQSLLITGPSGSGKSTLLHIMAGFLTPKEGDVRIDSQSIYQLSESARDAFRGEQIGMIFQQHHFVRALSALDNVLLAWIATGRKPDEKMAKEILSDLGLSSKFHEKPQNMSQGEQQRLSIARAMVKKPAVVLADEPTSSLDDANAESVGKLLIDLTQNHNVALVVVTHDQRLKDIFPRSVSLANAKMNSL
ncbi:MAG: ABC transporter ATP-binding protein [Flavobacteriales bacterium]|nr:MAG: ABC transporter ATP-binding protein [Flavobacteriales bacterium]